MHRRLVSYLRDNRDQVIENWLTEAEIPGPNGHPSGSGASGIVPLAFFTAAFETVVGTIERGGYKRIEEPRDTHMNDFIGLTCTCRDGCVGGRVCIELHESGHHAFMSVFDEEWDTEHEFNELDRKCCSDLINHALSGFFASEVDHCRLKTFRNDCPFVPESRVHTTK